MKIFNKILVANRGEIAVRIIRTLKKLGIGSVAVFSAKDRDALHVKMADEAYFIIGETLRDTYLNIDKLIEVAKDTGAEAIHPGYGFLSENPDFSFKAAASGIKFIGPPGDVIKLMGNKIEARSIAGKMGVPLIKSYEGKAEDLSGISSDIDYPCIVKAAAGGGGKAMRIIEKAGDFKDAIEVTGREALNYFGDDSLFVEKYFSGGRHIEVQVLVDHYGKIIIAGERDCSLQRRYQKVIEETPSVFLNEDTRKRMYEVSRKILQEISYQNAGTIEFLVDEQQNFYFLEMNTRIQVEHPVTEESTGIDLVEQQIYIAAGNPLSLNQDDVKISKHSIQARIYAEDPSKNFLPSPGAVHKYIEPVFPGLRIDSGTNSPGPVHSDFDPMISKVIVSAGTREDAIHLLENALKNYQVTGLHTNREFILSILRNEDYIENRISTTWLEAMKSSLLENQELQRKKVDIGSIFAGWLLKVLFTGSTLRRDPWHVVGYWRHQMRKSFIFEEKQYDIFVSEKKKDWMVFDWEGNTHEVLLQSMNENKIIFHLDGDWKCVSVTSGKGMEDIVFINGYEFRIKPLDYLPVKPFFREVDSETVSGPRYIRSPLHGKVVKLNASLNQRISKGELLFTLDAMKIENKIISPYEGCIKEIRISEGDQVSIDQEILVIDDCN